MLYSTYIIKALLFPLSVKQYLILIELYCLLHLIIDLLYLSHPSLPSFQPTFSLTTPLRSPMTTRTRMWWTNLSVCWSTQWMTLPPTSIRPTSVSGHPRSARLPMAGGLCGLSLARPRSWHIWRTRARLGIRRDGLRWGLPSLERLDFYRDCDTGRKVISYDLSLLNGLQFTTCFYFYVYILYSTKYY